MSEPENKPRLCLITLGCKANQYDSAAMLGYLGQKFSVTRPQSDRPADIYIINTCTVTQRADFDARQWIHRIKRWNPHAKIIVTGCMAEANRDGLKTENIDFIFRASERAGLIEELAGLKPEVEDDIFYHPEGGIQSRARAVLKVQEGCNFRCSYCIVPYARGKSRSLETEKVLNQVAALSGQGFEEIVLCGINLGEWGKERGLELCDLLEQIERSRPRARIRLSSLEPMSINTRLINTLQDSPIICPHLHIPMQSGDDEVLARMKRPYSSNQFLQLAQELLQKIPGLCLGLDLILGFPGETEPKFKNTLNLLQKIAFAYLHIFPFSARPNTPAKRFKPKVPEKVSRQRAQIISELDQTRRRDFALSQLGKKMELVVEGRDGDWCFGRSENYLYLKVRAEKALRTRLKVRLKEIGDELIGEET